MNYFNRYVLISYACGHRGRGTDTYQQFVTENAVQCPKCEKKPSHPFSKGYTHILIPTTFHAVLKERAAERNTSIWKYIYSRMEDSPPQAWKACGALPLGSSSLPLGAYLFCPLLMLAFFLTTNYIHY